MLQVIQVSLVHKFEFDLVRSSLPSWRIRRMCYIRGNRAISRYYWLQVFSFPSFLLTVVAIGSIRRASRKFLSLVDSLLLDVTAVHHGARGSFERSGTFTGHVGVLIALGGSDAML
jgi:hypothetical protein